MKQIKYSLIVFCLLLTSLCSAIDSIEVSSDQLLFETLNLQDLKFTLDITKTPVQLTIDLSRLNLAPPYNNISSLNLSCPEFLLEYATIQCPNGHLKFDGLLTQLSNSIPFSLSYNILTTESDLHLKNISLGQSTIALHLRTNNKNWQADISSVGLDLKDLKPYIEHFIFKGADYNANIKKQLLNNTKGYLDLNIKASGSKLSQTAKITARIKKFEYQYSDNMGENISAHINVSLSKKVNSAQYISIDMSYITGEFLQNDLYIVPNGKEKITAQLSYHIPQQIINFTDVKLWSKKLFKLNASGQLRLNSADRLKKLTMSFQFLDLAQFNQLYLHNIFTDTDLEGLEFKGEVKGKLQKNRKNINFQGRFKDFSSTFAEQFSLLNLNGSIYWNNTSQKKSPVKQSQLLWKQLILSQLPFGQTEINFSSHHNELKLVDEADIPLFDGALHINNLMIKDQTLSIDGFIRPVSLELISRHFNWQPLNGQLSAVIPATSYNEKYLKVGGAMMLKVFDGTIIVKDLEIIEPLKSYAQLSANIDLNNLDLQSLTKTYNFGEIHGRVEGKLEHLKMNAWQPVAFDAYIRTPENDNSSHKISQRAIDNLSSLGGASGLLSRSFLSFFETFRYNKLGLRCILKNNICQMSGVEEKGNSYYIVKGGGIPRIDVMGFQKRVDWQVLTSRLQTIQQANEAVIK